MFYYLIITAAVIFTLLMVLSFFCWDFPFLNFEGSSKVLQVIGRLSLVICQILLIVAVIIYPGDGSLIPYFGMDWTAPVILGNIFVVIGNLIIMAICEALYWVINIVVICLIGYLCEQCFKLVGWIFYGDKDHFFDYDD